jgi:ribosome-binding protein aMBF1 (putative translation factor)
VILYIIMITNWQEHKKQLLKNPEFMKALGEVEIEFQIAEAIIKARIERGLTQKELAKKLKTRQSVISRVESVKTIPTLSFLKRLAEALDVGLKVEFC